jgi:hypothetical protein
VRGTYSDVLAADLSGSPTALTNACLFLRNVTTNASFAAACKQILGLAEQLIEELPLERHHCKKHHGRPKI